MSDSDTESDADRNEALEAQQRLAEEQRVARNAEEQRVAQASAAATLAHRDAQAERGRAAMRARQEEDDREEDDRGNVPGETFDELDIRCRLYAGSSRALYDFFITYNGIQFKAKPVTQGDISIYMSDRNPRRDTYRINALVHNADLPDLDDREPYFRFGMLNMDDTSVGSRAALKSFIASLQTHHELISTSIPDAIPGHLTPAARALCRQRHEAAGTTRGTLSRRNQDLFTNRDEITPIRMFDMLDPYMLGDTATTTTTTTSTAPRRAGTSATITQSATPSSVYRLEVLGFWDELGDGFLQDDSFVPPIRVMFSNNTERYEAYATFARHTDDSLILPERFFIWRPVRSSAIEIRGNRPVHGTFPTMHEIMQASAHLPEAVRGIPIARQLMPDEIFTFHEGEAEEGEEPGGGMMDNMQQCLRCGNWRKSKC